MSDYIITCCSTGGHAGILFTEKNIPYACFHFTMDGCEYADDLGKSITNEEFYQRSQKRRYACDLTGKRRTVRNYV